MFDVLAKASGGVKAIFGCLVLVALIGPILVIVGLVMLTAENNRDNNIALYNAAVNNYDRTIRPVLLATVANVTAVPLLRQVLDVTVNGNLQGISPATHIVLSAAGIPVRDNSLYDVSFNVNGVPNSNMTVVLPATRSQRRGMQCTQADCTRWCSSSNYQCSHAAVSQRCASEYGGTFTPPSSSSDCDAGRDCGLCDYIGSLTAACIPLRWSGNSFGYAPNMQSCFYPFTEHVYTYQGPQTPPRATFTLMEEGDPLLALERLTEGRKDFGITQEQQRNVGVVLVIIGLIITGAMVGGIYLFLRSQKRAQAKRHETLEGGDHSDVQMGYPQQPPPHVAYQQPPGVHPHHQQQQQPVVEYANDNSFGGGYQASGSASPGQSQAHYGQRQHAPLAQGAQQYSPNEGYVQNGSYGSRVSYGDSVESENGSPKGYAQHPPPNRSRSNSTSQTFSVNPTYGSQHQQQQQRTRTTRSEYEQCGSP